MIRPTCLTYARESLSSSPGDISFGLQITPPLPPPKGMSTTAVFQVIHAASARTVSIVSSGWNLRPPFVGPRESLYWTRKPWKTRVLPSSILTGSVTWSSRSGQRRSSWIAASSFKSFAASSSCRCAIRNGLFASDIESSSIRPRIIRRWKRSGQAERFGDLDRGEAVLGGDRHRAAQA